MPGRRLSERVIDAILLGTAHLPRRSRNGIEIP
jgi:hypothetical protein